MRIGREQLAEVIAGAGVIAVAAGFVLWGMQATGFGAGTGSAINLSASFRSIEGISRGSEVRLAGVRVGSVTGVTLDPETFRAVATFSVQSAVPIPDDSSAVIASEGLLGGSFVEIMPGGSFDTLADGGEILDTQGAVSLLQLLITYVGGGGGGAAE